MSKEERKEILELLRAEADKTAEEHRQGEHFMNEIQKYAKCAKRRRNCSMEI